MKKTLISGMLFITLCLRAQSPESTVDKVKGLFSMYQYKQAIELLENEPYISKTPQLQELLAEAYQKSGQQSQALNLYQQLLKKDTTDVELLMRLGKLRAKTGNLKAAYSHFSELIRLQPENAYFHKLAGDIAKRDHMKIGLAVSHYQEARKINPSDEESAYDLASIYMELQQYVSARGITQSILEKDSSNTSILLLDCRLAYLQKHYPDVLRIGEYLLKNGDTITSNLRFYAIALYQVGRYDEAIDWLQAIASVTPSEQIYFYLSMAHYRKEELEQAELYMDKAIQLTESPSLPQYYTQLGIIYEKRQEYPEAIKAYKEAYRLNNNTDLLYRLARVSDEYYQDDRMAESFYEDFLIQKDTIETPQSIYAEERLSEIKKVRFFKKDTI